MKITKDNQWRVSSRDFFKSECEHCTRIDMAVAAGVPEVLEKTDPFRVDVSSLLWVMQGNEYERYVFDEFKSQLGANFVELEKTTMEETLELLRSGTVAVAQGYLETQNENYMWSGFPDLLLREDFTIEEGKIKQIGDPKPDPKYVVWDIKGTSKPDEKYWIQVASYSEVLEHYGFASDQDLGLLAKYGVTHKKPRREALDQLELAREILMQRLSQATPSEISVDFIQSWQCNEPKICEKANCSFPDLCAEIRQQEHSLHCIYGTNPVDKYNAAGILTYDDLIAASAPPVKVTEKAFREDQEWAKLLKAETSTGMPTFHLKPKDEWLALPEPTIDDLFFDIEWFNPVLSKDPNVFMFGFVNADEEFTSLESLKPEDELQNFKEFVRQAKAKMESNPLARIYHYHTPETEHLNKLAYRHDQLHEEVKFLISRMVNLRPIAMSMVLPGANSYSIKKLERYYDADIKLNRKENLVDGGDAAMLLYYQATVKDVANATNYMNIIRAYNRDDCLSTKLLRDWLISNTFD